MISEYDCTKILNEGEVKFNNEEVKQIRELLISLAVIEYEHYKEHQVKKAA